MGHSTGERVAILGSYAPSLINFRGPLIAELVARGHEVIALAPGITSDVAAALSELGAEVGDVSLASNPLNPLALASSLRRLERKFLDIRASALIAYTIQPATVGVMAAARAGVANIVPLITGLGYAFGGERSFKRRLSRAGAIRLYRWALPKSSVVIFQNQDDRRDLERVGAYRPSTPSVVVAGSGVDIDAFSPASLPATPSFLMVARLIREKGIFQYAEAARRLKSRHPQVRFALAGWIDSSPTAIGPADVRRMTDDGVEFLGKLSDVRPALAEASVFVLPSGYREGVPRSALEAMAMGRPIVTCDSPGCRETVVEGENGFLVPPFDADALCSAMEKFISDPSLSAHMGRRSRALAKEKFDVRKVNEAILEAAGL